MDKLTGMAETRAGSRREVLEPIKVFCPYCGRETESAEITTLRPSKFLCNEAEHKAFTAKESEEAEKASRPRRKGQEPQQEQVCGRV